MEASAGDSDLRAEARRALERANELRRIAEPDGHRDHGEHARLRLAVSERHVEELRRLVDNLERALATRGVIERAKGILMATQRCSSDEAFALLRRASQQANHKLYDVAARIVERYEPDGRRPVTEGEPDPSLP